MKNKGAMGGRMENIWRGSFVEYDWNGEQEPVGFSSIRKEGKAIGIPSWCLQGGQLYANTKLQTNGGGPAQ